MKKFIFLGLLLISGASLYAMECDECIQNDQQESHKALQILMDQFNTAYPDDAIPASSFDKKDAEEKGPDYQYEKGKERNLQQKSWLHSISKNKLYGGIGIAVITVAGIVSIYHYQKNAHAKGKQTGLDKFLARCRRNASAA